MRFGMTWMAALLLSGCMISREGVQVSAPPPSVQGSNDVQGSPLSVPGSGMGVGSGNPSGTTPAASPGGTVR
jgi:hypothetical protein